eukprot:8651561-Pyramimonas_sp.AAC.1
MLKKSFKNPSQDPFTGSSKILQGSSEIRTNHGKAEGILPKSLELLPLRLKNLQRAGNEPISL